MQFADRMRDRRRLEILLMLVQSPLYSADESTLTAGLADRGTAAARETLQSDVDWLAADLIVALRDQAPNRIVTLNQRGLDVARGLIALPGIARPAPEDLAR
jgi:hypothetical protein